MTMDHDRDGPPAPDDDAALSAYLDGELDDLAARRLEARLAEDPAVAARLDAMAEATARLRGLDEVAVPDGLTDRLVDGVGARLAADPAASDAPAAPSEGAVRSGAAQAGAPSARWWSPARLGAVAGAAAVLTGAAVVGVVALLPGDDEAERVLTEADDAPADVAEEPDAPADEEPGALAEEGAPAPDAEDEVAAPEALALSAPGEAALARGEDGARAALDGDASVDELARRWDEREGPTPCREDLPDVLAAAVAPVAVAAGETEGRDAVAYVVVAADEGGRPPQAAAVVVLDAADCALLERMPMR